MVLDLGARLIRLEAWSTAHTDSDLTVLDESTGTWFLGDLLFSGHVPALDGSLKGWLATVRALEKRHAERVVPGHGPAAMPWPEAAEPMKRYLAGLEADLRAIVKEGGTMGEAAAKAGRAEASRWELFDAFNARNATSAYHELEWE
jgi:glyoxylase-like metal-dependent hydrolase (beta-lactamase superfamily II)